MKITLRPAGATDSTADVVLADGADRSIDNIRGPSNGSPTVSIRDQVFNPIRASRARILNRENRIGSYPFKTSRRFATKYDAGRFLMTHGMLCPAAGTLFFDFGDATADPPGNLAVLFNCQIRQIGALEQKGTVVIGSYSCGYGDAYEVALADLRAEINAFNKYKVSRLINCGYILAAEWEADADYNSTGQPDTIAGTILNIGTVPEIVYQRCRFGLWEYTIALQPGTYDLKLHFCEIFGTPAASRIFNVSVNGVLVLEDFEILNEVAELTALVKTTTGIVIGEAGTMTIRTAAVAGDPIICGIEIALTEES